MKNDEKQNSQDKPRYYGIQPETESEKQFIKIFQNYADNIDSKFDEEFKETYDTIKELINRYDEAKEGKTDENNTIKVNNFSYPKTFHITTAFRYSDDFDQSLEYVKEFEEGKQVDFQILGVVAIPDEMIVTVVKGNFSSKNKFTHISTFIGGLKPKLSNDILCSIFDEGKEMEEDYNNIVEGKIEECTKKVKVTVEEKEYDGYVYLRKNTEIIKGRMKAYYS